MNTPKGTGKNVKDKKKNLHFGRFFFVENLDENFLDTSILGETAVNVYWEQHYSAPKKTGWF